MRFHWRISCGAATIALACACLSAISAQQLTIDALDEPPPGELADPIEALLAPAGQRVSTTGADVDGTVTLDFWWVKSMPLVPGSTALDWSAVQEGTLVGAVRVASDGRDSRGAPLRGGVYTLRYALRSEDGGDRAADDETDVLLLSPASQDESVGALGHDAAIALARQTLGGNEPAAWTIDPPAAPYAAVGSTRRNGSGRTAVVFAVPVSREGNDVGTLKFGVVVGQ